MPPYESVRLSYTVRNADSKTNLYSSAQRMKYVKRMVTVAVVSATTPAVNARKPKA